MSSQLMKGLFVAAMATALYGCGSDTGSGTETLYVEATAVTDGTTGGTSLTALVRDRSASGSIINDATVEMIGDRGGEHALSFFLIGYFKNDVVWEPGWKIRVTRGADKLEAYLQAPGLTTITEPTAAEPFSRGANQPLHVRWSDDSGRRAEVVEVTLDHGDYEVARPEDPGSRDIPHTTWTQAEGEERVTVSRSNDVSLAGGVTGSFFKATSTARAVFEVQ